MKEQELERIFLPRTLPADLFESKHRTIDDCYVPVSEPHPVIRIRATDAKYELTKKSLPQEGNNTIRIEETIPLTESEYEAFTAVPGKRLIKTRYYYERDGHEYEFGVYGGDLKGLVLIDVEFASHEAVAAFEPPDFLGQEVTNVKFLRGGELAGKKYSDIEAKLVTLGYTKLP